MTSATATPLKRNPNETEQSGEPVNHVFLNGSNSIVNNGRISIVVGSDMEVSGMGVMAILAAFREPGGVRLVLGPEANPRDAFVPNEAILMTISQPSGLRPRAA